jgi:threonine aldolase
MRQTGILAAAGQIALENMTKRMGEDRKNAMYLYEKLKELPKIELMPIEQTHINMIFFKYDGDSVKLVDDLFRSGIVASPDENGLMRFVTHYWITKERIDFVISEMRKVIG